MFRYPRFRSFLTILLTTLFAPSFSFAENLCENLFNNLSPARGELDAKTISELVDLYLNIYESSRDVQPQIKANFLRIYAQLHASYGENFVRSFRKAVDHEITIRNRIREDKETPESLSEETLAKQRQTVKTAIDPLPSWYQSGVFFNETTFLSPHMDYILIQNLKDPDNLVKISLPGLTFDDTLLPIDSDHILILKRDEFIQLNLFSHAFKSFPNKGMTNISRNAAISRDKKLIFTINASGEFDIYKLEAQGPTRIFQTPSRGNQLKSLIESPNGRYFFAAGNNRSDLLYDRFKNQIIPMPALAAAPVINIVGARFSQDSQNLIVLGQNRVFYEYNFANNIRREIADISGLGLQTDGVFHLSQDGKSLYSIVDLATQRVPTFFEIDIATGRIHPVDLAKDLITEVHATAVYLDRDQAFLVFCPGRDRHVRIVQVNMQSKQTAEIAEFWTATESLFTPILSPSGQSVVLHQDTDGLYWVH